MDLAYQAYLVKIKKTKSISSINSVHPLKKICEPNVQNPNEYILSLNKIPIISKSDNKEKSNSDKAKI